MKKFLHPSDRVIAKHREIRNIYAANKGFNLPEKEYVPFVDLMIKQVQFYDVIEIDQFDDFRKKILLFVKKIRVTEIFTNSRKISDREYSDLKKKLSGIKNSLDTVQTAGLFTINYEGIQTKQSSLLKSAHLSYLKTHESYFILRVNIKPSDEFNNELKNILGSQDGNISIPRYNSFKTIMKTGNFISHNLFVDSIKENNLTLLLNDLNYQVKKNITSKLSGIFTESNIKEFLPSIEHFETTSSHEIYNDPPLKDYFNSFYFKEHFKDEKLNIRISVPLYDLEMTKNNSIKLIYENNNDQQTKENHKDFYYLSQNLTFPWVIVNITKLYRNSINNLKRDIYDYLNETTTHSLRSRLIRFFKNRKYINLKTRLVRYKVIFKRFESEFSDESLQRFFIEDSLEDFKALNIRDEKKNLLLEFVQTFKYDLKELNKDIEAINDSFKNIEELNTYKTNLFLQYFSIIIAVLAFIFSFSDVKEFIVKVIDWIKNLF